jgi:hypothetical protein
VTSEQLEYAKYVQEWWKTAVSVLTPIAIAALTFFVTRALNEQQAEHKKDEQVLQLKQTAYARIGPELNKIYVFVDDVGDYRSFTPDAIIAIKRRVDRDFHMYDTFWSKATSDAYDAFMAAAFKTYLGVGRKPQLRTFTKEKRAAYASDGRAWKAEWDTLFAEERDPEVRRKYNVLVRGFLDDITSRQLIR